MKPRECKDCKTEGRSGKARPAPHPGPRCATHQHVWVKKQKERAHAARVKANFSLQPGEYDALLKLQGGGCAICGRPPALKGRRLAVDHDHSCCPGKTSCGRCVRGLLCWSCNKFLHHIDDDVERLQAAAEYLRNWPSWRMPVGIWAPKEVS